LRQVSAASVKNLQKCGTEAPMPEPKSSILFGISLRFPNNSRTSRTLYPAKNSGDSPESRTFFDAKSNIHRQICQIPPSAYLEFPNIK
jgi:hypothetical protein